MSAAADAVAAGYVRVVDLDSVGEPVLALLLDVYWDGGDIGQWAPLTIAIPRRQLTWCHDHDELGLLWCPHEPEHFGVELTAPDPFADAVMREPCEALMEYVNEHGAHDLVDDYYLTLTRRMHDELGVLALFDDREGSTPLRDQLVEQLSDEDVARWTAQGWLDPRPKNDFTQAGIEPIMQARITSISTARVYRRDGGRPLATTGPSPEHHDRALDETVVHVADNPAVFAGLLPAGAVRVQVQDLFDRWHEAQVASGAWLCVLPHRCRRVEPTVIFLDVDGSTVVAPKSATTSLTHVMVVSLPEGHPDAVCEFPDPQDEHQRIVSSALVQPLWPTLDPETPKLEGWRGDDRAAEALTLASSSTTIEITRSDEMGIWDPGESARDLLESRLAPLIGRRPAARAVIEATVEPLPGQIDEEPQTFALIYAHDTWAAVWIDRRTRREIEVTGAGPPPEKLDLRPPRLS